MAANVSAPAGITLNTPVLTVDGTIACGGISSAPGLGSGDGSVNISGNFNITGAMNITGAVNATDDVKIGSLSLKSHTHTAPPGGGQTSTPL